MGVDDDEVLLRLPGVLTRGWLHFGACAALAVTTVALAWDIAGLLPSAALLNSPNLSGPLDGSAIFVSAWVAAVVFFVTSLRRTARRLD